MGEEYWGVFGGFGTVDWKTVQDEGFKNGCWSEVASAVLKCSDLGDLVGFRYAPVWWVPVAFLAGLILAPLWDALTVWRIEIRGRHRERLRAVREESVTLEAAPGPSSDVRSTSLVPRKAKATAVGGVTRPAGPPAAATEQRRESPKPVAASSGEAAPGCTEEKKTVVQEIATGENERRTPPVAKKGSARRRHGSESSELA